MCEPCCLNLTVDRTAEVLIDPNSFSRCKQGQYQCTVKKQNKTKANKKTKVFKMARDPFDISRWNRNFYLRIKQDIKKGLPFKGI